MDRKGAEELIKIDVTSLHTFIIRDQKARSCKISLSYYRFHYYSEL